MTSEDVCPVCLEPLSTSQNDVMNLPNCGHAIHVTCALINVRYDSRCPVCRTFTIEQPPRPNEDAYIRFENELNERLVAYRLYRSRRSRAIRRCKNLRDIQVRLKEAQRAYAMIDRQLDREWSKIVRELWKTDKHISALKKERQLCLRRRSRYERQLRERLEPLIGDEPDMYI